MEHKWKLGWKTIRKYYYVDTCLNCGALRVISFTINYVKPDQATKFLTTTQPVEFHKYFMCKE